MEQNTTYQPEDDKKEDVISDYMEYMEQADIEFHKSIVRKARNALFLAAVLIFLGEIISSAKAGESFNGIILVVALIEGGLFAGLALWTKRKPYSAVMGGLIAFIGIHVLAMVVNGITGGIEAALLSLVSGVFMKIFILAALFSALKHAKTLQAIQRKGL